MDRHVRNLAMLNIIGGIGGAILAVLILLNLRGINTLALSSIGQRLSSAAPFVALYLTIVCWIMLIVAVPATVCGFGLRAYAEWARFLGIIVSLVSVLNFPVGSIIGAYGIWVLLSPETEYLFLDPPPERMRARRRRA